MKKGMKGLTFILCAGCLVVMTACGSSAASSTAASSASKAASANTVSAASAASSKAASASTSKAASSAASAASSKAASASTSKAASSAASTAASTASSSSGSNVISPLPSSLDIDSLEDCTIAASFEPSDVSKNSDGTIVINMMVCDYERYDMVDISKLAVGDTIVSNGDNIAVKSMEQSGSDIVINGGEEAGGFTLHTDDDGVYYIYTEEGGAYYYGLGTVTLPLSQDFVFIDKSEPQTAEKQMNADDFLTAMQSYTKSFYSNTTTVRIEGGSIAEVQKLYRP